MRCYAGGEAHESDCACPCHAMAAALREAV
jgi:hypothetical protein